MWRLRRGGFSESWPRQIFPDLGKPELRKSLNIMRLAFFTFLPEALVVSLEQIGIRTDSDLLFSASTADILQLLPPGTVTFQNLKNYIAQITDRCSAVGVRGDILLTIECEKQDQEPDLGSGLKDLDVLLNGFGGSRVFEVSGEKSSGKTVSFNFVLGEIVSTFANKALVMHITLRHLTNSPHAGALWMDTTGDFSAERVTQLLQLHDGAVCDHLPNLLNRC